MLYVPHQKDTINLNIQQEKKAHEVFAKKKKKYL